MARGSLTTTTAEGTASGSTPSSWDCFWHPIDCATTAAATASHSLAQDAATVAEAGTAPLHEVSETAKWTAIGIAAAAVAIIAISIVAVYAFHRI